MARTLRMSSLVTRTLAQVTDFAADAAHQNNVIPDPHEVSQPDCNNIGLTVFKTFDASFAYEVVREAAKGTL